MLKTLCLLAVAARVASAGVTTTLSEVPISPSAVAADSSLAGYRAFDLRVVVTPGDWFTAAGVDVRLTQGEMYAPEFEGSLPQPAALLALFPNLEFDTYVTVPGYVPGVTSVGIIGRYTTTGVAEPPQFPTHEGAKNRLNAVWGRLGSFPHEGTYNISRITLSPNSFGTLIGTLRSTDTSFRQYFAADVQGGAITSFRIVPEPALVVPLAAGLLLWRRRAR